MAVDGTIAPSLSGLRSARVATRYSVQSKLAHSEAGLRGSFIAQGLLCLSATAALHSTRPLPIALQAGEGAGRAAYSSTRRHGPLLRRPGAARPQRHHAQVRVASARALQRQRGWCALPSRTLRRRHSIPMRLAPLPPLCTAHATRSAAGRACTVHAPRACQHWGARRRAAHVQGPRSGQALQASLP